VSDTTASAIGAVVLLAAAFFGCVEQGAPEYDAKGRRLVKFSIPTRAYESNVGGGGGIRALSKDLAQSAWDYIEVVFKSGDEYYMGLGVKGNDVHFSLPARAYQAVMFAGIAAGKKLLAVGVPIAVDAGTQPVGNGRLTIETDTKRITFTLSALTADITAGSLTINEKTAPAPTALTFKIPTSGIGLNSQTVSAMDGKNPPYFAVPGKVNGLKGEFTIGGFKVAGVGVPNDANLLTALTMATMLFGVLDAAGSTKIIQTRGLTGYDTVTETFITPAAVSGTVNEIGIVNGELKVNFDLATDVNNLTEGFNAVV
jgi:hypothetical protein